MEDKNKYRALGYRLGVIFSSIVFACLTAITIALTIKFIFWLFLKEVIRWQEIFQHYV